MARKTRSTLQAELDELLSVGPAASPEVKLSRKTKRMTVTLPFEGAVWSVCVPSADLKAVCSRLTDLSNDDRIRLVSRLIDTLVMESMTISVTGTKKARGVQAGREVFMRQVRYAAAWGYAFVTHPDFQTLTQKTKKTFFPALARAEADIKQVRIRETDDRRSDEFKRAVMLTARLVVTAYQKAWEVQGLADPFIGVHYPANDRLAFNPHTFYETYIRPYSAIIAERFSQHPYLFTALSSAYLRTLLTPTVTR